MIALASRPPRPRTLVHPGRFNPVRIQMRQAAQARHIRLALQPGLSLLAALVEPLAAAGVTSASTTILGGFFDRLDYCVAPPDPEGRAIIAYTDPIPAGQERTFSLVGDLTVRDVTRATTWHVTARRQGNDIVGTAKTQFTFKDFNMDQPKVPIVLSVADTIRLEYDFHFAPVSADVAR